MKNLSMFILLCVISQTRLAYCELSVYTTASELMDWCKPYIISTNHKGNLQDVLPDNLCTGFITGVTDAHQRFVNNGFMPPYWCGPGGVSKNKLVHIVTTYLQANPEKLPADAAGAVANAVYEAFPCD